MRHGSTIVLSAGMSEVYEAARRLRPRLGRVRRRTLVLAIRSAAERAATSSRRVTLAQRAPEDGKLRLADMPTHGDWVLLGEERPHEIAYEVIQRLRRDEQHWGADQTRPSSTFGPTEEVACSFSLRPYGATARSCRMKNAHESHG